MGPTNTFCDYIVVTKCHSSVCQSYLSTQFVWHFTFLYLQCQSIIWPLDQFIQSKESTKSSQDSFPGQVSRFALTQNINLSIISQNVSLKYLNTQIFVLDPLMTKFCSALDSKKGKRRNQSLSVTAVFAMFQTRTDKPERKYVENRG